ncbi:alpha-amylase family protein [Shewanella intestini]|uniref:Alpha-amylase n=1 Tax=Shewanella intestini TaxID=2017544 RepID=A0ABS5HZB3_9GAMM|nr:MULTISPECIES: alpha-amylase family protein [Shewanella]MBR9727133.1 alpha-amylase [Shewanella intestini]MRG35935.1 alpha-amylase [Shewanella sp. XMDDZSB0408]
MRQVNIFSATATFPQHRPSNGLLAVSFILALGASVSPAFAVIDTPKANTVSPITSIDKSAMAHKALVYQVFTRLYGNTNTNNMAWGNIAQNGVGKFSDFSVTALQDIQSLGVTHIWYTGVPHHALINDYSAYGISNDDPDVVKGRAGSPYAVKDYYNVNPDLADNPAERLAEFEALIARTHQQGMKVIIDIVPNHVARRYQSLSAPQGVSDFGAADDTSVEYAKNNNFYYIQGSQFSVPQLPANQAVLGGQPHPLADGKFVETPAKWTGNGSRLAQPHANDWYETVKINYGVKPDGSADFPQLPASYATKTAAEHFAFWQQQSTESIPDSWVKFKQITQYWLDKGVDGFRYDMAEMVPVAFWSYLNSHIKHTNPKAFLLAEVYNPDLYRDYIHLGKMDYLYDKVDLYDTLKDIMHDKRSSAEIALVQSKVQDIEAHMLHFLENHDEQRIASADFAENPFNALPAMVLSTTLSRAPTLLYFGQDVGEAGAEHAGFGQPTRTSIFDYIGVPAHQRWMNNGKFDGGQSTQSEKQLRHYYQTLLNLSHSAAALSGHYVELDSLQRSLNTKGYNDKAFVFSRFNPQQQLVIATNFSYTEPARYTVTIPHSLIAKWPHMTTRPLTLTNLLASTIKPHLGQANHEALPLQQASEMQIKQASLTSKNNTSQSNWTIEFEPTQQGVVGKIKLQLAPLESVILALPSTDGMQTTMQLKTASELISTPVQQVDNAR